MTLHTTDSRFIFGLAMNNGDDIAWFKVVALDRFDQASVQRMRHSGSGL